MNRLVKDYSPEEGGKPGRLTQAVGDENASASLGERQRAGAADAARGAGDECGFS